MCELDKIDIVEDIDIEFKDNFDFKNEAFKNKIYKTIRAFANTYGGKLFIGINDNCEVVGIQQDKMDKISRHLCDVFKDQVELIVRPKQYKNKKWYLEIYIPELEKFIYEDKQMKEICIRVNSSLKILKGNEIIVFWEKKKNSITKINNFFIECCNKNLSIDWKYKIDEINDLNLKMDRFCNFFKSIWLNSKTIYFLNPEQTSNIFSQIIFKVPYFDYICKTLEFKIDFFAFCVNSKNFSQHEILSEKLGSLIMYYSGSILFKFNKYFEIVNYSYQFDDKLFENNIENIKNNLLKNIVEINKTQIIEIKKIIETKIIECNNNFRKYSIEYLVKEVKKILK